MSSLISLQSFRLSGLEILRKMKDNGGQPHDACYPWLINVRVHDLKILLTYPSMTWWQIGCNCVRQNSTLIVKICTQDQMKESSELPILLYAINTILNHKELSYWVLCTKLERQEPSWYISLKVREQTIPDEKDIEKVIEDTIKSGKME